MRLSYDAVVDRIASAVRSVAQEEMLTFAGLEHMDAHETNQETAVQNAFTQEWVDEECQRSVIRGYMWAKFRAHVDEKTWENGRCLGKTAIFVDVPTAQEEA